MLRKVQEHTPSLYSMTWQAYANPSKLFFGSEGAILSQQGIQQGDPMGSFLFALTTRDLMLSCESSLNIWYLDDVVLGGDLKTLKSDLVKIENSEKIIGTAVNFSKCEIMPINTLSTVDLSQDFPEIKIINPEDFTLLGSPVLPCAAKKCSWKN